MGTVLYGFCGGAFGRDADPAGVRRVEAVGVDWIVCRHEQGGVSFASNADSHGNIHEWLREYGAKPADWDDDVW